MLLRRVRLDVPTAVERLAGIQSQIPTSPYVGLWSRLDRFRREQLGRPLVGRRLVRLALMRSTIHLVTARDCLAIRPLVQPVLERGIRGTFGRQLRGLDLKAVARAGRTLLDERPRTFQEIGARLLKRWPDRDPEALAQVVRAMVPMVQIPPRGVWGAGMQATYVSVESWLGKPLAGMPVEKLVVRYLAAFGPATVGDIQVWCGLTGLRSVLDRLRRKLVLFRREDGAELFDVPRGPRPHEETPAPPRFLAEYDNMLLSYSDRSRIIGAEYRAAVYTGNGVRPVVLLDGFARATWRMERKGDATSLVIQPFRAIARPDRDALMGEAKALVEFLAADAGHGAVRIVPPMKK